MRFRPCIDLHNGSVKQIVGSTYSDTDQTSITTNFSTGDSPALFAVRYRHDNIPGGHVIMLGPGNEPAARSALKAWPGGLQIGGGITPENATGWLNCGASHVIMTSYVFSNGVISWDNLKLASKVAGRSRLVLDISCKNIEDEYRVVTDRWQKTTSQVINKTLLERLAEYCDELLVHAADVEGKQDGIAEDLIVLLGTDSPIAATYAGGIRTIDDLDRVDTLGKGKIDATIGSALDIFGGPLPYEKVIAWHRSRQQPSAPKSIPTGKAT